MPESKKINTPAIKSSIFNLSLSNSKKPSSINENSPRKTETLTSFNTKLNAVSNTSRRMPNSDMFIQISNLSKTPKYESHQNSLIFENFDAPLFSARSGINFKENSVEISPIVEENSVSENISQRLIHLSIEKNSFQDISPVKSSRTVSDEISPLRQVSKLSLQGSYEFFSENEGETIGKEGSPTKISDKSINFMTISFEEALVLFNSLKLEFFDQNL